MIYLFIYFDNIKLILEINQIKYDLYLEIKSKLNSFLI